MQTYLQLVLHGALVSHCMQNMKQMLTALEEDIYIPVVVKW